ncbi:MAG: branched-chain amino acid ABC transporter permease [Euryarchaeota archaeon]|nr:branched-chain amino acid ABC transporter permease [Euryarchaeota archaeon]
MILGLATDQLLELLWVMGIFSILSLSLNLVVGQAGLFQLGHVGFFAIGGIMTVYGTHADHLGLDLLAGILLGMAVSALCAVVIGLPTLRLRGDYFAIATLGFAIIVRVILEGYYIQGVYNIPPLNPFGHPIPFQTTVIGVTVGWRVIELLFVLGLLAVVYLFLVRLDRAPFGRALRAIREDEVAAQALGKNVMAFKLKAFVVSAMLAALAGSLYVHHLRVFDPSAYDFNLTILILVMVILGGLGSHQGAVLGAVLVTILNEVAKQLSGGVGHDIDAAALNNLLYSGLLVLLMVVRPQGILGDRDLRLMDRLFGRFRRRPGEDG